MPPKKSAGKKKKGETMSLAQFQQSVDPVDTEGSWGDRMADDIEIPQAITTDELREATGDQPYRKSYRPRNYDDEPRSYDERPPRDNYRQREEGEQSTFGEYQKREPRRRPDAQMATERPFVVYVGNLPFQDVSKGDLAEFFGNNNIEHIVLPIDREREGRIKGHGYVEFVDIDSYKEALEKNDSPFMGRNIRVDLTDPETAQRMSAGNKREGGFERREGGFDRRERVERPKSVADEDNSWRGGGKAESSPFGNKRREEREGGYERREGGFQRREGGFERREGGFQHRERREGGYQREERSNFEDRFSERPNRGDRDPENPFGGFKSRRGGREGGNDRREGGFERRPRREEEPEPTERPKINLKPRSVDDQSPSQSNKSDIFGQGKAWEETDEIKKKMESLELKEKEQNAEAEKHFEEEKKKRQEEREQRKEERAPREPREPREGGDNRQRKNIDFSAFNKKGKGEQRGERPERGGGRGEKRDFKKKPEGGEEKKVEKKETKDNKKATGITAENMFSALGEEDLE